MTTPACCATQRVLLLGRSGCRAVQRAACRRRRKGRQEASPDPRRPESVRKTLRAARAADPSSDAAACRVGDFSCERKLICLMLPDVGSWARISPSTAPTATQSQAKNRCGKHKLIWLSRRSRPRIFESVIRSARSDERTRGDGTLHVHAPNPDEQKKR